MADNKRVDLNSDLDQLLNDVKAATDEVKQRQDADKAKDLRSAEKEKSRKTSMLIIAAAAVVIFIIAYFVVFARPEQGTQLTSPKSTTPTPNVTVRTPSAARSTNPIANTPVVPTIPMHQGRRGSQVTPRPANDYEQPSSRPGM